MKIAFFVSSIGDTDLAVETVKSLDDKKYETIFIALTKTAQQRIESTHPSATTKKITLLEILNLKTDSPVDIQCTEEQIQTIIAYTKQQNINYAFIGVPSPINIKAPFQIAEALTDIPVLMAYEFMFKPLEHSLWTHLAKLRSKRWAVPLAAAKSDFGSIPKLDIVGHMSIDNAYIQKPPARKPAELKQALQITNEQSLAFISSTTQPVEIDATFLDCVLAELPKHPTIQIRLGLHPGIQDLDTYLTRILAVYQKHQTLNQFKIIVPDNLVGRIKKTDLSLNHPQYQSLFLRVNINGSEASAIADRVAQAVPGALLNQAAIEGKPVYSHSGKPYLPGSYFSESVTTFFTGSSQPPRTKKDLGLNEKTAPKRCAELILQSLEPQSQSSFYRCKEILSKQGKVGDVIINAMMRLHNGQQSYWNPYWINSNLKLDRIMKAVEALGDTETLETVLTDKRSALYTALNMQRITPITLFGRLAFNQSKTVLAVTDEMAKSDKHELRTMK